ncbi:unnamed protein product [Cochlearia groenlandica]
MCPSGKITTSITAANPDFRPAFEIIDADRDGKISSEDLRAFYAGISRYSSSDEDTMIGTMISVADENKDGFVEFYEFEKVLVTAAPPCRSIGEEDEGLMKEVFKVMDKDGDGRLSYRDLKSYMESAGLAANDDEIEAMIKLGGGDSYDDGVSFDGLLRIFGC